MKRWVRHEALRDEQGWSREPIDRHAPIRTPAPKTRRAKHALPSAGRLVLDDEPIQSVSARPRTAGSVQRRPRQDFL